MLSIKMALAIRKVYKTNEDYMEALAEQLLIPLDVWNWIIKNHKQDFLETFAEQVTKAEKEIYEDVLVVLDEESNN